MRNLVIICLVLFSISILAQNPNLSKLNFLIGEWEGTGSGFGNESSAIEAEFEYGLDGQYIEVEHESIFKPTDKKPDGEVHKDEGYISFDKNRNLIVYRQFNIEGFVNQYVLVDSLSSDSMFVFITESIENFVPGGKAKWTIIKKTESTIETIFELSFPGKEFACFGTNILKKEED